MPDLVRHAAHDDTASAATRFIDIVRTLQPATLIDGRLGVAGDYVSMGDNAFPNQVVKDDWEVARHA